MSRRPPTVALPTYNGARHLAEALRSILDQKGADYDLLVCDDRSEDDTIAIVRAEAGDLARVEVNSERLGLAENWNRCVQRSETPFVAIFHQDDVMLPGHLAAHVNTLEQDESLGMVCGAAEVIDDQGRPVPDSVVGRGNLGPIDRVFPPGAFVAELVESNPVRCSAVVLRKAAHAELGGFDPSYRYAVDWEFWLRLARRWAVAWRATPMVAIRWHEASETHRFKVGQADLDEVACLIDSVLERDKALLPDSRRSRSLANQRLALAYVNRAYEATRSGDAGLARSCLRNAVRRRPAIVGQLLRDPRLAARLAGLLLAPGRASR
ncbi:hypothetical protein BH23PLA1_BH23PLA1_10990 [soil metagenome]